MGTRIHTRTLSSHLLSSRTNWKRGISTSILRLAKASPQLLSLSLLGKETDHKLAREWVDNFKIDDIPKDGYEATRSRSSGPGGQHVNKTESKVTIRCDLIKANENWLPSFVIPALTKSPYYLSSPPSLLISSQTSRTASQNLNSALTLLHRTIQDSAGNLIINPTSSEQKSRVKGLIKRENEKRLEMKKRQSAKKFSRRDID
ncbi:uncharacterized protein IL334_004474 [Kwoniella shivajii]|uniref:Prokaryotic-type class I peptide chain release factors domain-containing protein n=1 Tax=Kwoniella shivajii TaxID=564305 RepID=A0ABZ1D1N8_9TREE|nr:hypothetical protein IL334_004474 [Kwoniella shivajii]